MRGQYQISPINKNTGKVSLSLYLFLSFFFSLCGGQSVYCPNQVHLPEFYCTREASELLEVSKM